MKDIKFRVWHIPEQKMYFRGYQKWFYVLLCEDDHGKNDGRGNPVKRAPYGDCEFLEWTGLMDKKGREIYEGDVVRIHYKGRAVEDTVGPVPDSFGSGGGHPLKDLFKKHGITAGPDQTEIEVIGSSFKPGGLHAL